MQSELKGFPYPAGKTIVLDVFLIKVLRPGNKKSRPGLIRLSEVAYISSDF